MYRNVDGASFLNKGAVLEFVACTGGEGGVEPREETTSLRRHDSCSHARTVCKAGCVRTTVS